MKLSAPKQSTWLISLAAGVLGTLVHYRIVQIAAVAPYTFLLIAAALALLLVATATSSL